jgi:hypothetical protein
VKGVKKMGEELCKPFLVIICFEMFLVPVITSVFQRVQKKGSPIFGPKEVCAIQLCQIPVLGMNDKPWSNHMSSARNTFLEICGLPIWVAGDGLEQGEGKGP